MVQPHYRSVRVDGFWLVINWFCLHCQNSRQENWSVLIVLLSRTLSLQTNGGRGVDVSYWRLEVCPDHVNWIRKFPWLSLLGEGWQLTNSNKITIQSPVSVHPKIVLIGGHSTPLWNVFRTKQSPLSIPVTTPLSLSDNIILLLNTSKHRTPSILNRTTKRPREDYSPKTQ